jgi:hypothetical protein
MSSNRFDYFQLLSEIEQCESAIDNKYRALLEMNQRTYQQIDKMLEESLDRKLIMMGRITSSLIERRNEGSATASTPHAS